MLPFTILSYSFIVVSCWRILFFEAFQFKLKTKFCCSSAIQPCKSLLLATSLPSSSSSSSSDDLSNETPAQREERMKLVRQIQATFYQDADDDYLPLVTTPKANTSTSSSKADNKNNDILENVPLFRVQWTELIGYQNMLNIHEPHYTHMFRRILTQQQKQKHNNDSTNFNAIKGRYGHVFLPNGSKNMNNPAYRYDNPQNQACTIGTLMQISDTIDVPEDGRLGLIVQAIERFQIINVTQHEPYVIATIQILPEKEIQNDANTGPLQQLEQWYEYEYYPTKYSECTTPRGYPQVSPLVNYNFNFFADEILIGKTSIAADESKDNNVLVNEMEYKVWVALDELLTTLGEVSGLRIPVPSQLLVLLPLYPPTPWPNNFRIEEFAQELQSRNVEIGTYTKSPFLRVAENTSYPPLRRARRFSYAVWILLESIIGSSSLSRQGLLECSTITERLSGAYEQLQDITRTLKEKRV